MRWVSRPNYGASRPGVKIPQPKPKPRVTPNTKKYETRDPLSKPSPSLTERNTNSITETGTAARAPTPRQRQTKYYSDKVQENIKAGQGPQRIKYEKPTASEGIREAKTVELPAWNSFWQGAGVTHDAKGKAVKLRDYVTEQTAGFNASSGKSLAEMIKASRKKDPGWLAYNKALREQRHRIQQAVKSRKKLGDQAKLARGGIGSPNIGGGRSATVIARQFDED